MNLPFTSDQFLQVFADYNISVWPLQIVFNLAALAAIILTVRRSPAGNNAIVGILSFLWLWIGIVYHVLFFSQINPAARVFGGLFVLEAVIIFYYGIIRRELLFGFSRGTKEIVGGLIILYALFVYPLAGYLAGHTYPYAPTFGLPCPTTIFTLGMFLWTLKRVPWAVVIIPVLWSLLGFTAALKLGIVEDTGLLVAGVVVVAMMLMGRRGDFGVTGVSAK